MDPRSGDEPVSRPAGLVKRQIETVRDVGIHGYCLFEYGYVSDEIIEVLRAEANREKAVAYFR